MDTITRKKNIRLSKEDRMSIVLLRPFWRIRELAHQFDVSSGTVSRICNNCNDIIKVNKLYEHKRIK